MEGPLELMTRKEFMDKLKISSLHGLANKMAREPECPRPFKFSPHGRVFFSRAEVEAYLTDKNEQVRQIMPGDRTPVI